MKYISGNVFTRVKNAFKSLWCKPIPPTHRRIKKTDWVQRAKLAKANRRFGTFSQQNKVRGVLACWCRVWRIFPWC